MDILIISTLISVFLAAVFDAFSDNCLSESEFNNSILHIFRGNKNYFLRELSWKNKWKNGKKELGEAFLGSSTFFVWLTDGWHLLKFLRNRFYQLAICLLLTNYLSLSIINAIFCYLMIGIVYGVSFEFFYKRWIYIIILFSKIFNK